MSTSFPLNLRATLGAIAPYVVPKRMKKLILFSSLTAALRQDDVLDKQTLEKLNFVMNLSTDVDAMKLPVYMRSAIWKGGAPIQIPESLFSKQPKAQDMQGVISEFISKIPRWLRYGRDDEMKRDAELYLLHGREFLDRRRVVR